MKWQQPQPVDDVTMAFPANVVGKYLPLREEIPERFENERKWEDLAATWFYSGLENSPTAREGVDLNQALRHLKTCLGSFQPEHNHKLRGVAWLMSLWLDESSL